MICPDIVDKIIHTEYLHSSKTIGVVTECAGCSKRHHINDMDMIDGWILCGGCSGRKVEIQI